MKLLKIIINSRMTFNMGNQRHVCEGWERPKLPVIPRKLWLLLGSYYSQIRNPTKGQIIIAHVITAYACLLCIIESDGCQGCVLVFWGLVSFISKMSIYQTPHASCCRNSGISLCLPDAMGALSLIRTILLRNMRNHSSWAPSLSDSPNTQDI